MTVEFRLRRDDGTWAQRNIILGPGEPGVSGNILKIGDNHTGWNELPGFVNTAYLLEVGVNGKSAYELALDTGYEGTLLEWLESLVGPPGADSVVPGPPGDEGPQGIQGEQGIQGIQGETGEQGPEGPQGEQGIQGVKGDKGDTGDAGAQGIPGAAGPAGMTFRGNWNSGIDYVQHDTVAHAGASWFASEDPPVGEVPSQASAYWWPLALQGAQGIQGIQGIKGDKGDKGDTGLQGPQGIQGIQGIQGVKGDTGLQGIQGIQGVKGDTGLQGIQGIQGVKGDTGSVWLATRAPRPITAITAVAASTEYEVFNIPIAAADVAPGDTLSLFIRSDLINNGTGANATITHRLKLGGVTLFQWDAVLASGAATRNRRRTTIDLDIISMTDIVGSLESMVSSVVGTPNANQLLVVAQQNIGAAQFTTVDMSTSPTLQVTVSFSVANVNVDTRLLSAKLRRDR